MKKERAKRIGRGIILSSPDAAAAAVVLIIPFVLVTPIGKTSAVAPLDSLDVGEDFTSSLALECVGEDFGDPVGEPAGLDLLLEPPNNPALLSSL